jgi:predicted secreted hydrolase
VDQAPGAPGFDLSIVGGDPGTRGAFLAVGVPPWTMRGNGGSDHLTAASLRQGFGFDLLLDAQGRPAVLHDHVGYIDFGPLGGSYYYSRPRMAVNGTLTVGGGVQAVTGEAWFDHQWGDFLTVGGGGWDWFAINLADGTDLTLQKVRSASGAPALAYGTLRLPDGTTEHLGADAFSIGADGSWTSAATGATYPAGWTVRVPGEDLVIHLRPTVAGQELDTRPTTGVTYWEGSQVVSAMRGGQPLGGESYVELTGYGPVGTPSGGPGTGPAPTP